MIDEAWNEVVQLTRERDALKVRLSEVGDEVTELRKALTAMKARIGELSEQSQKRIAELEEENAQNEALKLAQIEWASLNRLKRIAHAQQPPQSRRWAAQCANPSPHQARRCLQPLKSTNNFNQSVSCRSERIIGWRNQITALRNHKRAYFRLGSRCRASGKG
jgi:chromosome segregation ATPase